VSPNVKRTLSGNPPRMPVRRGRTPRSARLSQQSTREALPHRSASTPTGTWRTLGIEHASGA